MITWIRDTSCRIYRTQWTLLRSRTNSVFIHSASVTGTSRQLVPPVETDFTRALTGWPISWRIRSRSGRGSELVTVTWHSCGPVDVCNEATETVWCLWWLHCHLIFIIILLRCTFMYSILVLCEPCFLILNQFEYRAIIQNFESNSFCCSQKSPKYLLTSFSSFVSPCL